MKILAIETSCDDTCASVVNEKKQVLSNIVSSQEKLHSGYGGVFPSLAKREHERNLVLVAKKALLKAKCLIKRKKQLKENFDILDRNLELRKYLIDFLSHYKIKGIDKIAVTVGPGLEPCLYTGVNFAKALSFYLQKPIIGVNHLEAHILANWFKDIKPKFPAICLVVSGGNTQLILMEKIGKYKIIGETRDDAAGECFDKTARILGLGYPGGKEIAKKAEGFKKSAFNIKLPRPMIYDKNYDFSFSGLKTAVLYDYKQRKEKNKEYVIEMAHEIQNAIVDVLTFKTMKASQDFKAKSVILGGGVSANEKLRQTIKKECAKRNIECVLPDKKYTADNAAMVAITAILSDNVIKRDYKKIKPDVNIRI